jgi:glycosyltransferase involved in cell wall biosynthesis
MKVVIISTAAIPSPPSGVYAGVEAISFNLAEGLARLGDEVYLITTNESEKIGMFQARDSNNNVVGSLEVKATGPTDWGPLGERNMFQNYVGWLEKEFGDGQGVVVDFSWGGWPYVLAAGKLGLKQHLNMKVMHVCHAMANWFDPVNQKFALPPVPYPRMLGVSSTQAGYLSSQYGVPVRFVYNGINLPPYEKLDVSGMNNVQPPTNSNPFLLSLNRISIEKGIHNCIDVALRTGYKLKLVGPDNWVEPKYVADIFDKCHFSNNQIEYYGHVDTNTKWDLIRKCKAGVLCPDPTRYVEAFGINSIEFNAMGKPVIALRNGGHIDTIQNGINGFLCNSIDEMVSTIKSGSLDTINPDMCRIAAERFSVENMSRGYQELILGVMEDKNEFKW